MTGRAAAVARPACLAVLLAVQGADALAAGLSFSDESRIGSGGYRASSGELVYAPSRWLAAGLSLGLTRYATPMTGSADSYGAEVKVTPGPSLTASVGYRRFEGASGLLVHPVSGAIEGRSAERQETGAVDSELSVLLLEQQDGQGAAEYAIRLAVGASIAEHRVPVRSSRPGSWPAAASEVRQKSWLAGLTLAVLGTTIGAGHRWHSYAETPPAGAGPSGGAGPFAVSDAWGLVEGLPARELMFSLDENLGDGFLAGASHRYLAMASGGALVRETSAGLSYVCLKCLRLRAGRLWVRRSGSTTAYTVLGLAVSI